MPSHPAEHLLIRAARGEYIAFCDADDVQVPYRLATHLALLERNPNAALVFFWAELNRSVRIEGGVEQISTSESDAYFASRDRDGQLSSVTSSQSEVIESREMLDRKFEKLKSEFNGKQIPRPEHWGGYRLVPARMEFWQARFARLNDRVEYLRESGGWVKRRLQP